MTRNPCVYGGVRYVGGGICVRFDSMCSDLRHYLLLACKLVCIVYKNAAPDFFCVVVCLISFFFLVGAHGCSIG